MWGELVHEDWTRTMDAHGWPHGQDVKSPTGQRDHPWDLVAIHYSLGLQSYLRFKGGTGVGARTVQVPSEKVGLDP